MAAAHRTRARALSLALVAPGSVHLDLDDLADPGARSAIMVRILEAGHPLAPAGDADATVTVRTDGGGYRIDGAGPIETAAFAVGAGPVETVRLELAHRVVEATRVVAAVDAPRRTESMAAVDFGGPIPVDRLPTLVEAMHENGVTVVDRPGAAQFRLCVRTESDGYRLSKVGVDETCGAIDGAAVVFEPDVGLAIAALLEPEAVESAPPGYDAAVPPAAVLGYNAALPPSGAFGIDSPLPPGQVAGRVHQTDKPLPPGEARPSVRDTTIRAGAAAGFSARVFDVGAAVALSGAAFGRRGLGAATRTIFEPSRGDGIAVLETTVVLGPAYRWTFARDRGEVGLALTGGVLIHRADIDGEETEHRADAIGEAPVWFGWAMGKRAGVQVAFAAAWAHRGRKHKVDRQVVWERAPIRVGMTVGFHYDWSLR